MNIRKKLETFTEVEKQRFIFKIFASEDLFGLYESSSTLKKCEVYKITDFMLSLRLFSLFFEFMTKRYINIKK